MPAGKGIEKQINSRKRKLKLNEYGARKPKPK
jgi:hypothetical protein